MPWLTLEMDVEAEEEEELDEEDAEYIGKSLNYGGINLHIDFNRDEDNEFFFSHFI